MANPSWMQEFSDRLGTGSAEDDVYLNAFLSKPDYWNKLQSDYLEGKFSGPFAKALTGLFYENTPYEAGEALAGMAGQMFARPDFAPYGADTYENFVKSLQSFASSTGFSGDNSGVLYEQFAKPLGYTADTADPNAVAIQNYNTAAAQASRDDDGLGGLGGLIGIGAGLLLGPSGLSLMPAWGAGAVGGALGSGLSGGNPLTGALLGGIGGYVGGELLGGGGTIDPFTGETLNSFTGNIGDWVSGGASDVAALSGSQVGAMSGGRDMSWMDTLNEMFGTGDMATVVPRWDTYVDTLGDWPVLSSVGSSGGLSGSGMMNLMGDFLTDDKIQVLTNIGIPESVATSIAPSLSNEALQGVINLSGIPGGSNLLKTVLGGGGGIGNILGTAARLGGQYLSGNAARDAAQTAANAHIEAARIAADAAKFRPVGVTTRFGQSQFGYDPKTGNLISAGYTLSPEVKALQDRLMGMAPGLLTQYEGAQAATAPMGTAAQRAMQLGQGYLATSPQEQAAKYMAEQQAILAPTREREYAALENRLLQQGRLGLATGATSTGMGAANPEIEALMNARRMQDLNLAAQATQGGMDYAKFGAGMVGTGGDLLRSMYGTQTAAYQPFQTALGGATGLEELGKGAMDIGTSIGAKTSTAAADAGRLMAQGMTSAAQTMQPANAYSPWGSLLAGTGDWLSKMSQPQQPYGMLGFDPTKYKLTPI